MLSTQLVKARSAQELTNPILWGRIAFRVFLWKHPLLDI